MGPTSCAALAAGFLAAFTLAIPTLGHRSGCHRWHSCPSDTGSYVCGDLGQCSQCPDNQFCQAGQFRLAPAGTARAPAAPIPSPEPAASRTPATVVRVIDGDTVDVVVADGLERLRLIGLNTPETVDPRRPVECFGREASAKAKALLPAGLRIELEADPSQGNRDRYNRLLRYIRFPDGRNFARVMIEEGYGFEYACRLPYTWTTSRRRSAARGKASKGYGRQMRARGSAGSTRSPRDAATGVSCDSTARSGPASAVDSAAPYPCQPGQIKGNRNSGIYHAPRQQDYARTCANVQCFDSEDQATAAEFRRVVR